MPNKKIFKKLPTHIAFVIDGNGRWAKKNGLPRYVGHKFGVDAVKNTILNCYDFKIKYLSFFTFSTENWKRPQEEIDKIFELLRKFAQNDIDFYKEKNIKFLVSGDITRLPTDLQNALNDAIKQTEKCDTMIVNICLNYGGRSDIVNAVNKIIQEKIEYVDEDIISNHLYTAGIPDPDFVVRTSGEHRLSNFMIYQMAYSELYFPKTYWPDFNKKQLIKSLKVYQNRKRRFGSLKNE